MPPRPPSILYNMDDIDRAAIGDWSQRVYARFYDIPAADIPRIKKACIEEATSAYAFSILECATILRRAYALDYEDSWNILLSIDNNRTHILVLRDIWNEALYTQHATIIGEKILAHLGVHQLKINRMKMLGCWREWRGTVVAWLAATRPRALSFKDKQVDIIEFEHEGEMWTCTTPELARFLVGLWPNKDIPISVAHVKETIKRVKVFIRKLGKGNTDILRLLSDPLAPEYTQEIILNDWEDGAGPVAGTRYLRDDELISRVRIARKISADDKQAAA